jgi:murein DD-endopeptidase MepM/ murein hydrolase activator NlpD
VEPAGAVEPLATATDVPPEPTATPEPTAPLPPASPVEFDPPQLVLGGAVIVYLNQPATAATLTFGGLQYPMLSDGSRWWAIVGVGAFAETGTAPLSIAYNPADGSPQTSVESALEIVYREFPVEDIQLDPGTASLLDPAIVNNEEAFRASIFSGYTTQRMWEGAFVTPADGVLSSIYGVARSYNGGPVSSYHRGTDFAGTTGDAAYAAAAGRVVFAGELQVRGNSVIIDHGVGVFTAYAHLSAISVAEGEMVSARQLIGQIGSTGLVTGPHLHWEVVVRGIEVDGELWLSGAVGQ